MFEAIVVLDDGKEFSWLKEKELSDLRGELARLPGSFIIDKKTDTLYPLHRIKHIKLKEIK